MHPRHQILITLLTLVATPACSEQATLPGPVDATAGGNATGDAGAMPSLPGGDPDFTVPAGAIRGTTWFSFGETELSAFFADEPALRFHQESERIGQCRLMTYQPSSCTPECTGSDACIDRQCLPYPTRIDRGPIDWSWSGGRQTVSASETLGYHATGEAQVTGDVVVSVDGITLRAPSDHAATPDTSTSSPHSAIW